MTDSTSSTPQPINSSTSIDTSIYTWSTFFRALSGQLSPSERNQYLAARDLVKEESDCKRCDSHRDWLLQNSPTVTFLRQQISEVGPTIEREHIRCRRCTTSQTGGFDANYGILLCANQLTSRKLVEDTLSHELVHAYDHARFNLSQTSLRHQACTEIRASMLSGECRFGREVLGRGQWKFYSSNAGMCSPASRPLPHEQASNSRRHKVKGGRRSGRSNVGIGKEKEGRIDSRRSVGELCGGY